MNRGLGGLERKGGVQKLAQYAVFDTGFEKCPKKRIYRGALKSGVKNCILCRKLQRHLHRHLWCERGTKASTNLQEKNRDLWGGSGFYPSRITMIYRVHTIGWVMADSVETLRLLTAYPYLKLFTDNCSYL